MLMKFDDDLGANFKYAFYVPHRGLEDHRPHELDDMEEEMNEP